MYVLVKLNDFYNSHFVDVSLQKQFFITIAVCDILTVTWDNVSTITYVINDAEHVE